MGGTAVADKKNTKPDEGKEKLEALNDLAKKIPLFDDKDYVTETKIIPSGSLALNMAIGGGYPRGAIIDVFGPESAGKSLLSILALAEIQKQGGVGVVWDAERSYSKNLKWMQTNGVDTSKLKFLKLRAAEGCELGFDYVEQIVKAGAADLIVIDSIPALVPQDALDKGMAEHEILGRRAAIITRFCNRALALLDESKTTVMLINQIRANVASGPAAAFAPKTKETSNYSLRHAASLRLQVNKITKPKLVNGLPYSHRVKVVAVKNKVSEPYRSAEFDVCYTKGVDQAAEVADILVSAGEAEKAGSWIKYEGEKYQGRDGFIEGISADAKVFKKAYEKALSLSGKINHFGAGASESESAGETLSVEDGE